MRLLLLLVAGLAVHATNCPGECICRTSTHQSAIVACTGANLQEVPLNIGSLSIRTDSPLDLPAVLTILKNSTLPLLVQLNLALCSIESFENITFTLSNLQTLDLSQNRIDQLPDNRLVFNLTELQVLDLSHNFIQVIYGSPFRTLSALHALNLSANNIELASIDSFRGLFALQILDLSINNFTTLPKVFAPLAGLQHLNLSGNRLQTLADGCFDTLLRLQQLDVSSNRLTHVAPNTLQSLPSLARLLLAGNPDLGRGVKEVALLVGTGRRLQAVDASCTGLKHVPATLTQSVRTLRLAGNLIRAVRCGDLDSYPLLQLLDLTANLLDEIEEDALGRLEMLGVLYLTGNKLHAIPRSLPDGLEILHLEFNSIEQIVSGDLLGLPKLEVLLLNDNNIKVVQEGAFSQVTSLVTLDLSRNPISILPAGTLAGPTHLQMLKLSGLTVEPPAEDMAFPVLFPEYLVRIDLSGSVGLTRQLLADTAALAAFRELQELNLADTQLMNLRSDLLHYLPQMHAFHLTGNALNCTNLLWLALWMRRQDEPEYSQVVCALPPELYGTLVVDLQATDIQRETTTIKSSMTNQIIKDNVGVNAIELGDQSTIGTLHQIKNQKSREIMSITSVSPVEARNRSVATDRAHLFPVVSELGTAEQPVTDGHINEINPFDYGNTTEPSNYETSTTQLEADKQNTSTETTELQRHVNVSDSFIGDNVTADSPITPDEFTGTANVTDEIADDVLGETSMYSSRKVKGTGTNSDGLQMHPGMMFLIVALLGAGAALSTLVSHVRRKRLQSGACAPSYDRHQDIEVNSLSSMHELW